LGGESKAQEPRRVPTNFPHQIAKSKVPKTHQENHQERALKITTKNNREQHNKALRNHTKSSKHTKEVHTRSSLPPDHPTLSQNLSMKLSSESYGNPKKIGRENRKENQLGFQEMAVKDQMATTEGGRE
jgi:hypothetical protein